MKACLSTLIRCRTHVKNRPLFVKTRSKSSAFSQQNKLSFIGDALIFSHITEVKETLATALHHL